MTAVYIILGILLFFFLLSLLRIGVRADFAGDLADTRVTVIAGPARIQMLPKPDKPEKPKKPKKEKKKKTPQEEITKGKEKKKLSLSAQDIKTLLPAVWASLKGGLRKTRQRLLINPLELSAVLPGAMDPAGAAELYGYINAGMWTVMPQLEQLTRIPDPGLHVEVDFDSEQLRLTGRLGVSLQIRDLFAIGWAFVIYSQTEKSQLQNKEKAFRLLRSKLYELELEKKQNAEAAERRGEGEGGAERCKAARNSTHSAGRRGTYDHINFDKGELTMEMTEKKNDLKSMMVESMEKVKEMVDANNIVGEPITTPDGVTLIPVSRVSLGFGSGGGQSCRGSSARLAGCVSGG